MVLPYDISSYYSLVKIFPQLRWRRVSKSPLCLKVNLSWIFLVILNIRFLVSNSYLSRKEFINMSYDFRKEWNVPSWTCSCRSCIFMISLVFEQSWTTCVFATLQIRKLKREICPKTHSINNVLLELPSTGNSEPPRATNFQIKSKQSQGQMWGIPPWVVVRGI